MEAFDNPLHISSFHWSPPPPPPPKNIVPPPLQAKLHVIPGLQYFSRKFPRCALSGNLVHLPALVTGQASLDIVYCTCVRSYFHKPTRLDTYPCDPCDGLFSALNQRLCICISIQKRLLVRREVEEKESPKIYSIHIFLISSNCLYVIRPQNNVGCR